MPARITHRTLLKSLTAVLLAVVAVQALGQTTEDDLKARLLNHPLYLRGMWWSRHDLSFDSDGKPLGKYQISSFTLAGVEIHKIDLKKDEVILTGQRMGVVFSPDPEQIPIHQDIRIVINGPTGTDFGTALDTIFVSNVSDLVTSLPKYWQSYAQKHFTAIPDPALTTQPTPVPAAPPLKPLTGMIAPVLLSSPAPHISDAARALRFMGVVTIGLHIKPDGTPSDVQIQRPIGLGLDDETAAALSQYRFKPAMQNGKPVEVELNVEVNFRIF